MTVEDVKRLLKGKRFNTNRQGMLYSFNEGNTLRISGYAVAEVNYDIYEEDGKFYLKAPIKSEDYLITIDKEESPLTLNLTEKKSGNHWAELKEIQ